MNNGLSMAAPAPKLGRGKVWSAEVEAERASLALPSG